MKQFPFLLLSLLLIACTKPHRRHNEITEIEVALGTCYGTCQPTVTHIDSNLSYHYYGDSLYSNYDPGKEKFRGHYSGKITQSFWDTLNIKLEQINYKQLDTSYQHSVDDQSMEIFIHYNNKVKHIAAQSMSMPANAREVFYYIGNYYKIIKPKSTKDTFKFESKIQQPSPDSDINLRIPPPDEALKK